MWRETLLRRLDEIGQSLQETEGALALLALGSVGTELERIDEYSDLDFFVVVAEGYRQAFLDDLAWLTSAHPVAYSFMNTSDGYKLLFADGVYCELAVFEPGQLRELPFPEGRIVWKAQGVDDAIRLSSRLAGHAADRSPEWLIGEALTNLFVGLGRFYRGEKLSASRFIQVYALDRALELAQLIEPELAHLRDVFGNERRFEQRYPWLGRELPLMAQGYERSPESAASILDFLDRHFDLNLAMKQAILDLLARHQPASPEELP